MNFPDITDPMIKLFCFILLLVLNSGLLKVAAQSKKVIIDCDPGVDDAMALILAMQYTDFDILGITTVFGNAYLEQTTKNALTVVELSNKITLSSRFIVAVIEYHHSG